MNKKENELINESINEVLDQLATEYKESLIRKVMEENNYESVNNIDVNELFNADNKIKKVMQEINKKEVALENKSQKQLELHKVSEMMQKINFHLKETKRKTTVNKIILILGILYGIVGISIFFVINKENIEPLLSDQINKVPILISIVGVIMSLITSISILLNVNEHKSINKRKVAIKRFEMIDKWKQIENLGNSVIKINSQESGYMPLSKVISKMYTDGYINDEDIIQIKRILNVRNSIVHSTVNDSASLDISEEIKIANKIIKKLKRIDNKKVR